MTEQRLSAAQEQLNAREGVVAELRQVERELTAELSRSKELLASRDYELTSLSQTIGGDGFRSYIFSRRNYMVIIMSKLIFPHR